MMSWLKRETSGPRSQEKREVPEGLWVKCDSCGETIYARELERNLHCCPKCGHHFRINSRKYAEILLDGGRWTAFADDIESIDPLGFTDTKPYLDRYAAAVRKTKMNDAVLTAKGSLGGRPVVIAFMEFGFIGGS
ncbi:MAG: acetyl-CoA carboxylase carboxyl transferase subunit beta, partial [bacterium]